MARFPTPPPFDIALSGVLIILGLCETWFNVGIVPKGPVGVCEIVIAGAVAWRRAAPLTAIAIAGLASVAEAATGVSMILPAIPLTCAVILIYTVVSYVPIRRALVGTVMMAVWISAQIIVAHQSAGNFLFAVQFLGGAWLLGRIVRVRTAQALAAQSRVDGLRRDQEERAQRALTDERSRIARELHDVIAHSVSVMVVQAGAAQEVLHRDPARASDAMGAVQTTGRQAITELSRLLGVMREGAAELGLEPQPSLAELPGLLDQARAAGLPVELIVVGTPRALPPGVELTVYRIVQEALTNARKHAGVGASACVRLALGVTEVTAEVSNTGASAQPPGGGAGNGLIGMRERAAASGGTLAVERTPGGLFIVRASLPVEATA